MVIIPVKTRLEADGILNLRVPTGLPEADVDVIVTVQPVGARANTWPKDFFEETYGAFAAHSIERGSEGAFEDRLGPSLSYLLDTNICIRYLNGQSENIKDTIGAANAGGRCLVLGSES